MQAEEKSISSLSQVWATAVNLSRHRQPKLDLTGAELTAYSRSLTCLRRRRAVPGYQTGQTRDPDVRFVGTAGDQIERDVLAAAAGVDDGEERLVLELVRVLAKPLRGLAQPDFFDGINGDYTEVQLRTLADRASQLHITGRFRRLLRCRIPTDGCHRVIQLV